jgi:DHA2 family multidrug resistance protein
MMPRGYASLFATPLVGFIVAYVDPRKLVTLGLVTGAASLFWFSHMNLEVGYWNLFWPQFLQGVSFSLLMVPLTVVAMDRIAPAAIGNAASLFNLMRNLGGSFGIAVSQTLLDRFRQGQVNILGSHVSPYSRATRMTLAHLYRMFVANGSDPTTASRQSYAAVWGMVQRQATMVSYVDVFRLLTFLFLLVIPLVLLLKKLTHQMKQAAPAAH